MEFKQSIPFRQKIIIGTPIIILSIMGFEMNLFLGIILLMLAIIIFSLNYSLVILKPFQSFYVVKTFNISILRINKKLDFPDYISLFHQSFKQTNNVGFSPKILGDSKYKLYTIKLFTGSKNNIIFQSSNKNRTIVLASELSVLFNLELHNTLE